jgi:hypothetical protein
MLLLLYVTPYDLGFSRCAAPRPPHLNTNYRRLLGRRGRRRCSQQPRVRADMHVCMYVAAFESVCVCGLTCMGAFESVSV